MKVRVRVRVRGSAHLLALGFGVSALGARAQSFRLVAQSHYLCLGLAQLALRLLQPRLRMRLGLPHDHHAVLIASGCTRVLQKKMDKIIDALEAAIDAAGRQAKL